jgi:hypothetical protein
MICPDHRLAVPGAVVGTTHEQDLTAVLAARHPQVVIWILGIPVQRVRDLAGSDIEADHVAAIRRLAKWQVEAARDRRVRGVHDRPCTDHTTAGELHVGCVATLDRMYSHACVNPTACGGDRSGQAAEVRQWLKLRLVCESQATPRVERQRRACGLGDVEPGAGRRRELARKLRCEGIARRLLRPAREQVAVDATKFARDLQLCDRRLDRGDRGAMTLRGQTCTGLSEQRLEVSVTIIERAGQVRAGPSGFAATDGAIVHHGHGGAVAHERVGNAQARDSGTDDANLRLQIVWNWLVVHGQLAILLPDRGSGITGRGGACAGHRSPAKQVSSRPPAIEVITARSCPR